MFQILQPNFWNNFQAKLFENAKLTPNFTEFFVSLYLN